MRKIIVTTFTSLDGVMQAPGGPQEDPTSGFTLGGWTAPHFDQALGAAMGGIFGRPFDLLLGRKTYDIFARTGPSSPIRTTRLRACSIRRRSMSRRAPIGSSSGRIANGWARTSSHR